VAGALATRSIRGLRLEPVLAERREVDRKIDRVQQAVAH
jgi:hypothetical protein